MAVNTGTMQRRVVRARNGRAASRSRLVAAGLSVGAAIGITVGMVSTEHPLPTPAASGGAVASPDPFRAGGPATPPGRAPAGRIRQTVTSAS